MFPSYPSRFDLVMDVALRPTEFGIEEGTLFELRPFAHDAGSLTLRVPTNWDADSGNFLWVKARGK
jgi:hypothetical protein